MDSFLQVTAADDAEVKLAAKKTVIISSTRYQQELGKFVAAAGDETDLDSRLHLVEDEVRAIVTEACAETGYDDIPGVTASILMTARQHFADKDKAVDTDGQKPWENQEEDEDSEDEEKTSRVAASAEGTPVPKMDKRKWTPKSLGEIPKDDADGRNPTVQQDVADPASPVNTDEHDLEQIGEKGTLKREDVTKSYTDQVGEKGNKHPNANQANPVTAAGQYAPIVDQDAHKNPVQDVLDQQFNGFVPQNEVDRAISLHNAQ